MADRGETRGFRNPGWWRRPRAIAVWLREAGPLWPLVALVLAGLVLWGPGLLMFAVILAGLIVLYELRERAWRRALRPPAPQRIGPAPPLLVPPSAPAGMGPAPLSLTQDDYVAVLERDQVRAVESFRLRVGREILSDQELAWDCRRCQQRARTLVIHHPIWEGPFDGAGSGVVDTRVTPYCVHCDALTIAVAWNYGLAVSPELYEGLTAVADLPGDQLSGLPLRLPWTGVGAIRLHPRLWLRAPFHNLLTQVERAIPPPPAPKDVPHVFTVAGPIAGPVVTPCEVCGRIVSDPIHTVSAP